ncbi:MAG: AIR synthase related protein [Candidatus Bathyarchaeia archaeon]
MSVKEIIELCKGFRGFTRKSCLGDILRVFGDLQLDDAGFIEVAGLKVVVSTDGILEDLVKLNPYMAGLYSVVVNVNDVVAKGAKPIGYVNVISSPSRENRLRMAEGVKAGVDMYGLKVLKGHTHPDQTYESIDAAVIGVASQIIPSGGMMVGDKILVAIDLAGSAKTRRWIRCFDSIVESSRSDVERKLSSMMTIAEKNLAHASRDISAPGVIGSLTMMCESSGMGVTCNLEKIPRPDSVNLSDWLTMYPSVGFILATDRASECSEIFEKCGLTVGQVGQATADKKIVLTLGGEKGVFMDLTKESMFGLKRSVRK